MTSPRAAANPWHGLWAMIVGFFMILVDSTIVAVANPSIMESLGTDYDTVLWVTSAYLLAYAVPLLVAGRLGDQYGPKNLYLIGLFVFTAASLWCGLSGSIDTLIAARVVQGIGAALLTPQTLTMITRTFPAERRGVAMSVWGATAGVATLVGPLAGGVLVDHLGWQWIFFVNVPIGVIGLALAIWLVPELPTDRHRFDILGVILSGAAMFLVVFGLQEGEDNLWSPWIWGIVGGGVVLMAAFVYWQAVNKDEPLIPLSIFRDRNYSVSSFGVAVIGFVVTAMIVPVMFYAQVVCGLTPTRSALLMAPMAIATGVLAPVVGRIVDRVHPTPVIGFGFSVLSIALTWLAVDMTPTTPIWRLLLPLTAMGLGMAFIWSPLAATATRNLAPHLAGAGSGAYNATRQLGSVLGGAGIAAFMTSRISAEMPGGQSRPAAGGATMQLPEFLREPFSAALSQSMLLPALVALSGVVAALFFVGAARPSRPSRDVFAAARGTGGRDRRAESTEIIPAFRDDTAPDSPYRREFASSSVVFWREPTNDEYFEDDDEYVEFEVADEPEASYDNWDDVPAENTDTEPLALRVEHPRRAPAEVWHSSPVESWHSLLPDSIPYETVAEVRDEPIGFAHNGFHVEDDEKVQPIPPAAHNPSDLYDDLYDDGGFRRLADDIENISASFAEYFDQHWSHAFDSNGQAAPPSADGRTSRHRQPDGGHTDPAPTDGQLGRRPRHYRDDPDDSASYGRHSAPQWE